MNIFLSCDSGSSQMQCISKQHLKIFVGCKNGMRSEIIHMDKRLIHNIFSFWEYLVFMMQSEYGIEAAQWNWQRTKCSLPQGKLSAVTYYPSCRLPVVWQTWFPPYKGSSSINFDILPCEMVTSEEMTNVNLIDSNVNDKSQKCLDRKEVFSLTLSYSKWEFSIIRMFWYYLNSSDKRTKRIKRQGKIYQCKIWRKIQHHC